MLNKLISLVFLLFFLLVNKAYAENEFILPAQKPSIFKKIEKIDTVNTNLPQKNQLKNHLNLQKKKRSKNQLKKRVRTKSSKKR